MYDLEKLIPTVTCRLGSDQASSLEQTLIWAEQELQTKSWKQKYRYL